MTIMPRQANKSIRAPGNQAALSRIGSGMEASQTKRYSRPDHEADGRDLNGYREPAMSE